MLQSKLNCGMFLSKLLKTKMLCIFVIHFTFHLHQPQMGSPHITSRNIYCVFMIHQVLDVKHFKFAQSVVVLKISPSSFRLCFWFLRKSWSWSFTVVLVMNGSRENNYLSLQSIHSSLGKENRRGAGRKNSLRVFMGDLHFYGPRSVGIFTYARIGKAVAGKWEIILGKGFL